MLWFTVLQGKSIVHLDLVRRSVEAEFEGVDGGHLSDRDDDEHEHDLEATSDEGGYLRVRDNEDATVWLSGGVEMLASSIV